jgi:mRNA interferase MazF
MGSLAAGTVVLVSFPFSDLSQAKLRPALVLGHAGRDDWILCQITSNPYADSTAVSLADSDFASGSLARDSFLRPNKLFTAQESLIARVIGRLHAAKLSEVRRALGRLLSIHEK